MRYSSPIRRIEILRFCAGVLAGDQNLPPNAPRPGRSFDWGDVRELALELGIGPPLWRALSASGSTPTGGAEELHEIYRANAVRNLRLRDQLREAVRAFNQAGIVPLLFKGALHLVDGTLELIADRWMEDLDIAVLGEQLVAAAAALRAIEYFPPPSKPFRHPHEVPFYRVGAAGPIELHVELGSPPLSSVLPVDEAWAQSAEVLVMGSRARALSPTHQVLHNVLHSAVQDFNHAIAGLPLRQLIVLSSLVRANGHAIDWDDVRRRMAGHGLGSELEHYLWLAHRYAGMPLPSGGWVRPRRLRDSWVQGSFALGWPADLRRNLRYAFGRAYLDSLYGHGDRPAKLVLARCRHAIAVLRRDQRQALDQALSRRI